MWFKDGSGFPLTLKPSHLFGATEFMDVSEVLAAIVERACVYTPEIPVGVSNLKEALIRVEKGSEEGGSHGRKKALKKALFDADKVPMVEPVRGSVYPDLVRYNRNH